jgi:hypothetical protein
MKELRQHVTTWKNLTDKKLAEKAIGTEIHSVKSTYVKFKSMIKEKIYYLRL